MSETRTLNVYDFAIKTFIPVQVPVDATFGDVRSRLATESGLQISDLQYSQLELWKVSHLMYCSPN
jgi:hypothetical protein